MYMCVHMRIHLFRSISIYLYDVCMYVDMYLDEYIYIYTYIHTHTHTRIGDHSYHGRFGRCRARNKARQGRDHAHLV